MRVKLSIKMYNLLQFSTSYIVESVEDCNRLKNFVNDVFSYSSFSSHFSPSHSMSAATVMMLILVSVPVVVFCLKLPYLLVLA